MHSHAHEINVMLKRPIESPLKKKQSHEPHVSAPRRSRAVSGPSVQMSESHSFMVHKL